MNISNTFVIEDGSTKLAGTLGLKSVEFTPNLLTNDAIEEWLATNVFGINSNIEKLIIPVRLGNDDADYLGLRVGLHIRLTKNRYDERFRFIPLIFASVSESKERILGNQIERNCILSAILLFTKGCTIVDFFDLEEAVNEFIEVIDNDILKIDLLKKLVISDERLQGHQLANEWGVFRLAKFAGIKLTSIKLPTDLFFKYQFSKSDRDIQPHGNRSIGLQNKGCNALLIDDNAEIGWVEVLQHILQSHINLHSSKLEFLTTFEDAYNYQNYESKDIVFLDLRLKPEEDRVAETLSLEDLSGLKLLRKIKGINKGIQVIVLTASNKAWNMKALLDEGADGYFIKESPEIPVSDDASKANYESLVASIKEAFERRYLRGIFKEIKELHEKLDNLIASNSYSPDFLNELKNHLSIAFDIHNKAKSKEQFAFAFVTLYLILEAINNQFVTKDSSYNWLIDNSTNLNDYTRDDNSRRYDDSGATISGNKPAEWKKTAGLYFQKWTGTNHQFITTIRHQIQKRNGFVHNDKNILDKTKKDRNGKDVLDKDGNPIYLNHDIFRPDGFKNLFASIKTILGYL